VYFAPAAVGIGTTTTFDRSRTGDCMPSSVTPRTFPATTKTPIVSPASHQQVRALGFVL